jgi:uncharacterized membrane protein YeaQ/YmgE (transglycosylase-associated protein family)
VDILTVLIVGAIAGWLGSLLMKSKGLTLGGYLVLGILGALVGDFVFGLLGFVDTNLIAHVITATIGAMIVIWLVKTIWKKG